MFEKILVANRGEIAIRVMRACREMKIQTVAVYSEADSHALFAKYADEAHYIGLPPASQSYLRRDRILEVAEKTGAQAIHPGYGFLAENADFVRECEKAGIVFIGPSSASIDAAGSKIMARKTMEKAGVPVIPGISEKIVDNDVAIDGAQKIGYPVIVKAAAGGGGIGMKIAYNDADLIDAIQSTRKVAQSTFGDSTIFMEKYLASPRHIEFQIMADSHGHTVHVNERECSIQRRHQKLIEESPSPVMTPELRDEMGAAAIRAAKAIDYTNAGTVEFMYSDGDFYFLEMNTRLQVEHPITEMVSGLDLVREQIHIAAGETMDWKQEDIKINGWAMECRINAEDPLNDFVPSPGKLLRYRSPGGPGIRVDSGVHFGYTISPFYDSMVSKLISWGRDRTEAIEKMRRALYEYIIVGVTTNIPFHKAVLRNPHYINGELSTHFIEDFDIMSEVAKVVEQEKEKGVTLASAIGADDHKVAAISAAVKTYISGRESFSSSKPNK
ncbi:MAG: acetyl-CoA carboxylase biotin carboxylase subunit [ANME-2 cluster archaeon]|nr:acetyl-CoA carboxylase biotin carboxylase subunit [ANME-2 cluster archaeon]